MASKNISDSQLLALKADIAAQVAVDSGTAIEGLNPLNPDDAFAIADWYNEDSAFWTWKPDVSSGEVGAALNLSEVGGLTTANSNRVNLSFNVVNSNGGAFHPERVDHRGLFQDVFSAAGGSLTRAALLPLWQRLAKRGEELFATGTGTQCTELNTDGTVSVGSPGTLAFEGDITPSIVNASNNV